MFGRKKDDVTRKKDDVTKWMFSAVKDNKWSQVEEIIRNDQVSVNVRDNRFFSARDTILHWACRHNKVEIVNC